MEQGRGAGAVQFPARGERLTHTLGNGSCRPGPDGRRIKLSLRKAWGCVEDPWREQTCSESSAWTVPGWMIWVGISRRVQQRSKANLALLPSPKFFSHHSNPFSKKKLVPNKLLFTRVIVNNNNSGSVVLQFSRAPLAAGAGDLVQLNYSLRFITSCF